MAEAPLRHRWGLGALFAGLAVFTLFLRLLPLDTAPGDWPGPDIMLALAFAWVLRRPDCVPAPLIVAVFLAEDILTQRPPGLWTAVVLLGTEFLRGRVALLRGLPFWAEWAMVGAILLAMTLVARLVLAVTFVPQAGLEGELIRVAMTLAVYPAVAFGSRWLLGLAEPEGGWPA